MKILRHFPRSASQYVFIERIKNGFLDQSREVIIFVSREGWQTGTFVCLVTGSFYNSIISISCEMELPTSFKVGESYHGTLNCSLELEGWQEINPYLDKLNIKPVEI
jgi:carbamoylphosphate synthase large subunit